MSSLKMLTPNNESALACDRSAMLIAARRRRVGGWVDSRGISGEASERVDASASSGRSRERLLVFQDQ